MSTYRVINPYCALPFYTEPLEAQEDCMLYASTLRTPPWIMKFDTTISASSAKLYTLDGTEAYTYSVLQTDPSAGGSYLYHRGQSFGAFESEGCYRIHLEANGTTYYSHPICLQTNFAVQNWQGIVLCTSASGGGYEFDFGFFSAAPAAPTGIEFDFGQGYFQYGTTTASFDQDDIAGSGSTTVHVRFRAYYDAGDYWKVYRLVFDTADACGTFVWTPLYDGGSNIDRFMYLEWSNSTDLDDLELIYATGSWVNRFYFRASPSFPVAVTEETFLTDGQNEQVLQSVAIAEQLNIDAYPVPDALYAPLAAIRYHDSIKLVTVADGLETTVKNFTFQTRTTENDLCLIGQIAGEIKRKWVTGCEENIGT